MLLIGAVLAQIVFRHVKRLQKSKFGAEIYSVGKS